MATERVRVVAAPARALAALATGGLVVLASVGTSVLVLSSTSDLASDQAPQPLTTAAQPTSPSQVLVVPARPAPAHDGQARGDAAQPAPAPLQPLPLDVTTLQVAPAAVPVLLAGDEIVSEPAPEPRSAPPSADKQRLDEKDADDELQLFSLRDVEPDADDVLDRRHPLFSAGPPYGHAFGRAIAPGQGGTGPAPGSPPPGVEAAAQNPVTPAPAATAPPAPAPPQTVAGSSGGSSSSKTTAHPRGKGKPAKGAAPRGGGRVEVTKPGGGTPRGKAKQPGGRANNPGSKPSKVGKR